jgi:hypothetical protein
MAVIFFLVLVALVVVVWAAFAFIRGSKEVVDKQSDLTTGHELPAEKGGEPSLLEEDLSFANRPTETEPTEREREHQRR